MKRNIIILAALMVLAPATVNAQYNETNNLFYFAQRAPQSNQLNPAFFPSAFYLQLPALNSLQLGLPLSISDVAKYDSTQGANIIDVNHIFDVLGQTGYDSRFRLGFDMNVVGLGLKIAGVFVDANMQLKTNLGFTLPFSAISTVMQGNVNNDEAIPEMTLLDGDLLDLQMYLETSVGAGFHVPLTGLTVGAHVKLLSGILNVNTQNTKVTFNTDEDFNTVSAKIYYQLMGASIVPINTDTSGFSLSDITGNLLDKVKEMGLSLIDINGGNNGMAFDLGAKYDFGPLTVSASINDLSAGIHWHNNVFLMKPKGDQSTIEFNGMDISNLLEGGNINVDSLTNYLNGQLEGMMPTLLTDDTIDFWYAVPTKMNLGVTANLGILKAGLLFHGQWDRGLLSKSTYGSISEAYGDAMDNYRELKNTFRSNTTLSVGVNLFNWVELIAGSSFVYEKGQKISMDNFLNPGLGIIVTPATLFQAYFMMDYASSMYLTQMKAFNFKFGFNIIMGGNSMTRIL